MTTMMEVYMILFVRPDSLLALRITLKSFLAFPSVQGFNADQMNAVAMSNRQIQQREREIRQIAKSVNELAEIFRDMAELVHEQGSILDRIDYNLEQTKEHMVEAKKELKGVREGFALLRWLRMFSLT
jgi:methyl-accepting chemotaxis protein